MRAVSDEDILRDRLTNEAMGTMKWKILVAVVPGEVGQLYGSDDRQAYDSSTYPGNWLGFQSMELHEDEP